jgi:hypothetical protein
MIDPVIVNHVATEFALDEGLLVGQVHVESNGRADSLRYEPAFYEHYIRDNQLAKAARFGPLAACSYGPLQIMLEVAYEIGFAGQPVDLFDAYTGLRWGAKYLRQLLDWADGDYVRALCAYNGGKQAALHVPYRTLGYAQKVFDAAGRPLSTRLA